jgi:phosphatidylserine/phosphatidylglycerophosphate/cardiolipin synthase-like enzyme
VIDALLQAAARGVQIRVVADQKDNQKSTHSAIIPLMQHHIPVRLDGHYAIMHNKFLVVDEVTTETGSFNFTASGNTRNADNALIIWNDPPLAAVYSQEFEHLWQESQEPGSVPAYQPSSHTSTPSLNTLSRRLGRILY